MPGAGASRVPARRAKGILDATPCASKCKPVRESCKTVEDRAEQIRALGQTYDVVKPGSLSAASIYQRDRLDRT